MRMLLSALALAGLMATFVVAQDDKDKKKDPSKRDITLKVGDAAPALKATKWLQGDEVKSFETGKIYVVEFWATWCGPCIVMMPHLSELQEAYKSKGVRFIGFSPKDDRGNNEAKVTAFVKKRGPKLKYTFAYDDGKETHAAWMEAAGQGGIPCCFVVDKASKIAYIGHPMYLDVVLPKVVAGKWDIEKGAEEMESLDKEVSKVFQATQGKDAEASLKTIKTFETKNPALANIPYLIGPKITLMLKASKLKEARKMADDVLAKAIKQEDPTAMRAVSSALRGKEAKGDKDLLAMALKAANAMVEASGKDDALALFNLAETYLATGDKDKAVEYGKKAVEAADTPALKKAIEQRVKAFGGEKKDDN